MLFTKATMSGIQLENALILSPEQYKKAQIPANNKRILNWAKDNHINIWFITIPKPGSEFNCVLGIMMDSWVSDNTMSTNKKMLKRLGEELTKFIDDMSDGVDEANKDAENHQKVEALVKQFEADVKSIYGEDVVVHIGIYKMREIDANLLDILRQAIDETC